MNKEKYQQALNTLFMMSSEHLGFELNYEKNLLQELVDIYPEYLELKAKATDDYEIIELHMSSTYGGGR